METIQYPIITIPGLGLTMTLAEIGDFRYLRYAICNATKYVRLWEPSFTTYFTEKQTDGKHYNVDISHAAKKLVRLIFSMEKSGRAFRIAA